MVCMYVCMCVCRCMCVSLCVCAYVCAYVHMCVCAYVSMYVCTYVCMYVCLPACLSVSVCLCLSVCMYVGMDGWMVGWMDGCIPGLLLTGLLLKVAILSRKLSNIPIRILRYPLKKNLGEAKQSKKNDIIHIYIYTLYIIVYRNTIIWNDLELKRMKRNVLEVSLSGTPLCLDKILYFYVWEK